MRSIREERHGRVTRCRDQVISWRNEGTSRGHVINWLRGSSYCLTYSEAVGLVAEVYEECRRGLVLFNDELLSSELDKLISLGVIIENGKMNVRSTKRVIITNELVEAMHFDGNHVPEEERDDFEIRAYSLVGKVAYGVAVEGMSMASIEDHLPNNGPNCRGFADRLVWHKSWVNENSVFAEFSNLPEYRPSKSHEVVGGAMILVALLLALVSAVLVLMNSYMS